MQASQYLGRAVTSLTDFESMPSGAISNPAGSINTPRNLTRTLVDTAMSRFAKTETRAAFVTDGGTPAQQQRSESCTEAANSLIEQTHTEIELRKAALHACVFDLGTIKIIEDEEGPRVEHRFSWETMFDPIDGRRGKTIRVERFTADKDALIAEFAAEPDTDEGEPEESPGSRADRLQLIDDIRDSSSAGLTTADHTMSNQHCVGYELWRLPVGRTNGRHVIVTDKATLLDEVWTEKTVNCVDFGWSADPISPYPVSIAAINSANQFELDGVGTRISQILRLMAVPRYIEQGVAGETTATQIRGGSDAVGDLVQVPPGKTLTTVGAGNMVGGELFQHEDRVWQRGFQMTGINESASTGTRPAGLNSAPAQREWNEINQDRLSLVALDYQQAHVEAAERLLSAVAKIPEYEITVKSANGRWLKRMKAADLELDRADYVIQRFPISALPTTPTGKLAAAADLLQMGAIDKDDFKEMVQLPDLKSKLDIALASRRAVESIVAKMMREHQFIAPSDRFDLNYALKYSTTKWLEGLADDMPEDDLALLDDWINNVISLQKKAAPPAPAAPTAGTSIAPIAPQPLAAPVGNQALAGSMPGAA